MGASIRIHSFADVDRSGKVRWTAAELGLDVEEMRVKPGDNLDEAYLRINPYGMVPATEIDGQVLIESTATCIVLAERNPESGLIPQAGDRRERFWRYVAVATTSLEQPVVAHYLAKRGVIPEDWARLYEEPLRPRLRTFAGEMPGKGYLCGDFTLADVFAGYVLRIGVQSGLLEYAGDSGAYLDRLRARPAAVTSRVFDSLDAPA